MRPTGGTVIQLEKDKPRSRCRKWELRANFGCVNGKYPKRTKRFDGTYREAKAALTSWLAELELEDKLANDPIVGDYLWSWHEMRDSSGRFAHKTMVNEVTHVRMLEGYFDDMRLSEVSPDALEDVFSKWRGQYRTSTCAMLYETLSTCFKHAVSQGLMEMSQFDVKDHPKHGRVQHTVLSDEEMDALVKKLDPRDGRQLAVMLCLAFGLRRGEVVALDWEDWDGESMHVERADAGDGTVKPPKTPAGVRSIPAPKWMADVLNGIRDEGNICGVTASRLNAWWYYTRGKLGVSCSLHELRHSYLTRLARHGVHPRVMMQLAGHDTMSVCMEIYTHVSDDMQKSAVANAFS